MHIRLFVLKLHYTTQASWLKKRKQNAQFASSFLNYDTSGKILFNQLRIFVKVNYISSTLKVLAVN